LNSIFEAWKKLNRVTFLLNNQTFAIALYGVLKT